MGAELEDQVDYALSLQNRSELKNVEILSDSLIANKDLPTKIEREIKAWSENLRKILLGTVSYIEENKFSDVEQAVTAIEVGKYDQNRISNLLSSQQKLSLSFETLNVAIELFSRVNEGILAKVREAESLGKKTDATRQRLKNAVLVYELTSFLATYIEKYGLLGVDDISSIRQEVFNELKSNEGEDSRLKKEIENATKETKELIMRDISNREGVRDAVKRKWEEFDKKIKSMREGVTSAKNLLPDLQAIKLNARNQIDILQIVATVQLIETSLEIVKNLTHIKKFSLAPLTPEDACNLLGIPVQDQAIAAGIQDGNTRDADLRV